jgi:para-aminobenzoate synthetase component I
MKSWYGRSVPLDHRTGSEIFSAFFGDEAIATLLESPYPPSPDYPKLGRYSICAGGPRRLETGELAMWTPPVGEILPFLRSRLDAGSSVSSLPPELPFGGGWLGWLGYDLAWEIERLPKKNADPLPFPVAYWYEPDCFAVLDHDAQVLWIAVTDPSDFDRLLTPQDLPSPAEVSRPKRDSEGSDLRNEPRFLTTQAQYEAAILTAKDHIYHGHIFQANVSLRFETQTFAASWDIYQTLQAINPSPFASYWRSPFGDVVSCSPERLVLLGADGGAEVRPIAGTRPRGDTMQRDQALVEELRSNEKERAEHLMLVDLERNDLGRVCEFGSVVVDELLAVERYSHVMHLVSNVQGKLRSGLDAVDLIRAVFPGGTITGCPKVRCMEIIETLEPVRRSLFYGSCGYLDMRGRLDLNILIRTLLYAKDPNSGGAIVWGQVGAGIVADSEPEREWLESLQKASAQIRALALSLV